MNINVTEGLSGNSACTSYLADMPLGNSRNAMATVEVTGKCDLSCPFCTHPAKSEAHKSLRTIQREIATIVALSPCDTIVLAGGEPLLHPELEAAVKMVISANRKPILLTNGILLTRERLTALKAAGLFGIMFHVNAMQNRPGWENCAEVELNSLRLMLAELANEFGLHCGFNTLVFPDTLADVQRVALWASSVSDKVHMMTFIATRVFEATISRDDDAEMDEMDEMDEGRGSIFLSPYHDEAEGDDAGRMLSTHDIYDQIQKVFPGYRFNSFLGSTAQSGVLKWAMGTHLCRTGKHLGNLGPTAVALIESLCSKVSGRDISHLSPGVARQGWLVLLTGLFDREARRTIWRHWVTAIRKPLELFRTLHLQTFVVMQSFDILPEREGVNCNGCSRKTTIKTDRFHQRAHNHSYMLRNISSIDAIPEDSMQVQWPRQSPTLWRNSELERIGREDPLFNKIKN